MILACAGCGCPFPTKEKECWQETAIFIKEKYDKMYNNVPRSLTDIDWKKEKKDLFG